MPRKLAINYWRNSNLIMMKEEPALLNPQHRPANIKKMTLIFLLFRLLVFKIETSSFPTFHLSSVEKNNCSLYFRKINLFLTTKKESAKLLLIFQTSYPSCLKTNYIIGWLFGMYKFTCKCINFIIVCKAIFIHIFKICFREINT
jgi:hypothetical protein